MPYFQETPVVRVTLPSNDDYWVDLATDYEYGQIKKFIQPGTDEQSVSGDEFLQLAIRAWNLDDAEGNVVEINQANIDKLKKDDVVFLITEAGGLINKEDPKKKNSTVA